MAYQNVGTPRFYIDQFEYLRSIGFYFDKVYTDTGLPILPDYPDNIGIAHAHHYKEFDNLFGLDCNIQKLIEPHATNQAWFWWDLPTGYNSTWFDPDNSKIGRYVAYLNHNFKSMEEETTFTHYHITEWIDWDEVSSTYLNEGITELGVINFEGNNNGFSLGDGFSIYEFNKSSGAYNPTNELSSIIRIGFHTSPNNVINDFSLGSLSFGTYYDMPVSPDLDLSMTIDFDGYDNTETLNGSTLTNVRYAGSPWWYDKDGNKVEPWSVGGNDIIQELYNADVYLNEGKVTNTIFNKRNGRRIWNLKFSYMSDKDLFSSNYGSSNYTETTTDYSDDLTTDENNNDIFYYNIDNDDSFSAQVLNKISHGQKFIFQPNNTASNPSDFAICVLDADSFSMKRVAYNVYDISMKIKEVW